MNAVEALSCRMAFSGLPAGEVQRIVRRTECGSTWLRACLHSARGLRQLATRSEAEGRLGAARDAWLWAAAAYQAASFCVHFAPTAASLRHLARVRRLARVAYARAMAADGSVGVPVEIPCGDRIVRGYLRRPAGVTRDVPVVVLLNGLDSICEVEMHAFGTWLLSRGCATMALDLPADASSPSRVPMLDVEHAAEAITTFAGQLDGIRRDACGAFGVSFGGYLSARMLTAGGPFRSSVAVSPPAWIDRQAVPARIRTMLGWTFGAATDAELEAVTARIRIAALPRPRGKLLLFQMDQDQLFDERHAQAIATWGGSAVETRRVAAEHVGTSSFHQWLPFACDWLQSELA
jgi:dienelactone hydrolase